VGGSVRKPGAGWCGRTEHTGGGEVRKGTKRRRRNGGGARVIVCSDRSLIF